MDKVIRILESSEARGTVLARRPWGEEEIPEPVRQFTQRAFAADLTPEEAVRHLLAEVRARGDAALSHWTERLDGVVVPDFEIPPSAWQEAYERTQLELRDALAQSASRIEAFHRQQPAQSWISFGAEGALGQLIRPIERVGIYVPGGTAPLPSSLLMSAIPARVAGVDEIVICTPPQRPDGYVPDIILAAAHVSEVQRLFRIGGALAIAAMTFGTESVPRVDKVCGPGNLFVTLAKRMVFGWVGVDGLPGPTETLVIADEVARPDVVAADLLAQAEHDVLASAILLTPSYSLAQAVQRALAEQMETLARSEIIAASLATRGAIVTTRDLDEAMELANVYAPEHLCLLVKDPWSWLGKVRNAGGVFLGEHSYEVLGDYVAGPSHVMPTGGTARFASPLSVADFLKRVSVVGLGKELSNAVGPTAEQLARAEGLTAHAAAVRRRMAILD